eukprot:UN20110
MGTMTEDRTMELAGFRNVDMTSGTPDGWAEHWNASTTSPDTSHPPDMPHAEKYQSKEISRRPENKHITATASRDNLSSYSRNLTVNSSQDSLRHKRHPGGNR